MKKLIPALLAVVLLSACGGAATPKASPTPTETKNPYGSGFTVSNPADTDVVLTIKGSTSKDYTMAQLKKLATKTITIEEPFVKAKQTFNVILLKSLFNGIDVPATSTLNTVALNDYAFKSTSEKFFGNDAYLAVLRDGQNIPMDAGGPIRIVFDTSSPWFTNLDAWNWSLRTIEVL